MAKKLGCASCGGTMKKMKAGGTTKSVSISKPGAGVVKETKGDTNQKMGIYGIAQTGPTGPNNSGIATMKKGGMVKKMQDGGGILTPDGRIKSNKTRNLNLSGYGDTGSVSRNKRNGDVVTRTTQTSNGYAGPTATKTKTISNKEGDTISEKTKNISPKIADRKINRVINNVGRNANDTYNYKKGGAVKKPLMKAQSGTSVGEEYKRKSTMQNYLDTNKNKGAVPSDTLGKTSSTDSRMGYYSAANPKNNKALYKAVKTRDTEASKALDEKFTRRKNETNAAYTKRTSMKVGGAVKTKKK